MCGDCVIHTQSINYVAEKFRLKEHAIEQEGKEPSPAQLKRFIGDSRSAGVRVVFTQQEFDEKHAQQIAKEIGAHVVSINPLDYQWDMQMKKIADALINHE